MKSKNTINFTKEYFNGIYKTLRKLDLLKINLLIEELVKLQKNNGRIFFIGVGGSSANSTHAVNDFRKLCNIESYSPFDNFSELTARINDDGWDSSIVEWLKISKLNNNDVLFVLSVGGGNIKKKVSVNIVKAIKFAKKNHSKILGIVGKKDGYTYKKADLAIFTPVTNKKLLTPYSESFQSVILHCIVSDPRLQKNKTKW